MSAPDLARSIRRRLCDTEDNKEFVPDDAIQEFTSRTAVQAHLMANQQALPEDIAMQPLINYVIDHDKPAKRVFLILELCNSLKYLTTLRDAGFCDKDLPIEAKWSRDEDRYIVRTKASSSESKVTNAAFNSWIDNDIRFFKETQWLFMAPVFVPNRFDYEVEDNCPLPIQKRIDHGKGGYSGVVHQVTIHQAHLKIDLNGKGVASKEIHLAKREYFKKEADSLRLLHRLGHPHLIQPLAAYQRGVLLGFLFPWAGGGTLREFWEKHQRARTQGGMKALVRWVLSQLCGLSGATTAMHDENCRHTDLKPLNILLFEEENSLGTLCIADVGLAKIHEDDTEQRKLMNALATKARTGTERYIPPEFGHVNQLSRVFDVWSLGCVFLEFLIWTVHGWDELQNFIAGTKQFWQDRRGRLDSEVDKYIVHLKQVLDAENSSVALRECLRLVTDGMLVWDWDKRNPIATTHAKLKEICQRGENDASYLLKMEIPISEGTLESVSMSGYNAQEVEIPELSILEDRNVVTIQSFSTSQQSRAQSEIRQLHEDWQLLIDNEFARRLFDGVHMQTTSAEGVHDELCSKCTDIWNVNFVIFEQMMEIQKRSQHCSVCGLIYSAGKEKGLGDTDNLSCRRVGSAVRVDPDGPTILSLFADPSSDFQIALLKQWIRVCDGEHNHQFDSHTKLPTRILDLGTAEKPLLCLRDGVGLGVAPYVALSHCWGTGNRFITLKSNLEEHKKHIGLDLLPETFKDAVRITRALSYRFLWIDSLCIVQDDLEDWENEAASMEQVFSSANVTIAASSSPSSEEGFLSVKRDQTASVTVRTPSNGTGFICKSIDTFHRDVESSVLNNRGWVFQERALSRRTIHFTSSQVYWECGSGIHCESLMKLTK
ncbi:Serine/threonine-protein kinase Nek7 [Colletotrichum tropicale]|nr:Serine/threonine-protein kinase Nek7 [Colletotrichum tropicale]